MTNDRLLIYGVLIVTAGIALYYFPAALVFIGVTIMLSALVRAYAAERGQEG
jgi:hypothetical protein